MATGTRHGVAGVHSIKKWKAAVVCLKCPKCGAEIKRFDLSVNCKSCGVNLYVYSQERELTRDAKITELDFAGARRFVAKLKAAYISNRYSITRLVMLFVCVAVFLIPFSTVTGVFPWFSQEVSFSAIGCYNIYNSGVYTLIFDALSHPVLQSEMLRIIAYAGVFILCLITTLVLLVLMILCSIDIHKYAKKMIITSAVGMVFSAVAFLLPFVMNMTSKNADFITYSPGFGALATLAAFAVMLAVNVLIIKHNIQPIVKEVDLKRIELKKLIKKGAVNVDDLPLPVFESEEERLARMETFSDKPKKKKKSEKRAEKVMTGGESDE